MLNMMMKHKITTMKVDMRQLKRNLAFHQMDAMNLKLTPNHFQNVKEIWTVQKTGAYYLLSLYQINDINCLSRGIMFNLHKK